MTIPGPIEPALDLVVELSLHHDLIEMFADGGQWWDGFVRRCDLVDQQLLVGHLDLLDAHGDPGAKPLFDECLDRRKTEGEFVQIRPDEAVLLQLQTEVLLTAATGNQEIANTRCVELETVKEPAFFDFTKLHLEPDSGIEQPRSMALDRFVRLLIHEANSIGESNVAEQDWGVPDNRKDFLDCLPLRFLGGREVTESHEDEGDNAGSHPGMIPAWLIQMNVVALCGSLQPRSALSSTFLHEHKRCFVRWISFSQKIHAEPGGCSGTSVSRWAAEFPACTNTMKIERLPILSLN